MSHSPVRARVRSRLVVSTVALGVLAAGLGATVPAGAAIDVSSQATSTSSGRYLVLMKAVPAAAYDGGVAGYRATAPAAGDRFDADTLAAERYSDLLVDRQDAVANTVGADPYYHYTASLNGFAAELSSADVSALSRRSDVSAVVPDEVRELDTTNTPGFLGLSGILGLWRRLGGSSSNDGAGRGVVVGIVDSGLDSDNPSFSDVESEAPDSWTGECDTGDGSFACNNKVIGGHYYTAGQGGDAKIWEEEFLSPEDFDGHGSHTASTAAGNSGTAVTVDGFDFGTASGMAPAAKLAPYKVCWADDSDDGSAGCTTSDSVAAIDQAVKDGVDVINFSISGAVTTSVDPVEIAFLYAADAGVFVATSAGNRGPGESTVAHPSPWLTTVAATTHTVNESTLVLGNGERYVGASVTGGIGATPMVLAEASVLAGQDPEEAALCFPGTLDPAAVAGQMVVCDRGVNDRAEKSRVVEAAGGVAMVLANVTPGSLNGDLHAVPSVHVDEVAGAEIKDYVATEAAPTGEILAGVSTGTTTPPPPAIAGFSSRGPSLAADGDLLKPDIAAPGVDVLAAVAPEGNSDRNWDFYSGTSMSSPHIAGLAALIAQRNPTWSPMTIKSAMMTTAGNLNDSRDPFLQGAGFVQPNSFMNPGLAFDSDFDDWEDFLSGQGLPLSDNPVSASNFNTASVAINDMAGTETVTREVTNVSNRASTYTFSKTRYRGFKVSASPSTFRIAPGESQRIGLSFARTVAPLDQYAKGNLFLKDDRGHTVRFPAVVKPVALAAPPEVPTADEAFSFEVKSGVSGTIKAGRWGLVPGVDTEATAQDTSAAAFDPEDERNYTQNMFVGGPNVTVRVQLDGDFDPGDDLDLFMVAPDGETVVAASAAGGSEEIVTLTGLERGRYTAHVQAWAIDGAATSKEFIVRTFKVPPKTVANWTVTPVTQEVRPGQFVTYTVRTDGLQAGTPYLGAIVYRQVEGADEGRPIIGRTLVSIG